MALIDDEEATLKRLRKRGASIALEAANPAYETRIFGPDRVQIQGKLVSLLRRYLTAQRRKVAGPEQSMRRPLLDCSDRPTSWTQAMRRT